jgi:hypothetical protein
MHLINSGTVRYVIALNYSRYSGRGRGGEKDSKMLSSFPTFDAKSDAATRKIARSYNFPKISPTALLIGVLFNRRFNRFTLLKQRVTTRR